MQIKGAVFDMDGVLLNSEVLYQRFWIEALRYYGYNATKEHILAMRSLTGKNAERKLKSFFGEKLNYETVKNKRAELMESYIDKHGVEMKKGADKILPILKNKGIKLALATSSPLERAKKHLSLAGIFKYFDEYICGSMVENSKPAPDIYLLATKKLGLSPDECIAVEDSPNGVISAVNAGCKTIMVPDLTPCPEELKDKVFAVANTLLDIEYIINSMRIAK
ncbi:MAG: HAD family phosphatase [Ruminococcus sp.]|nr:HAD family phosphatase [Ruminococcus sp.]